MQYMIDAAQEKLLHVLIIEGIEYLAALFVGAYQVHLAQTAHMVGYCRGTDAHSFCQ